MKLASLKTTNCRDGELCIVSKDLSVAFCVPHIVPTLQIAIENWDKFEPLLTQTYLQLNAGELRDVFDFDPQLMSSPLPRAYQWAEMPANFWTDPLMYQGGSDNFLGPCDPIAVMDESYGIDFEAEVAIITDDVPMGIHAKHAAKHIRLLMLVNDVSLRNLIPDELAKGFGFFQSKPASSFSPVAVTPDELEPHWDNQRLHLPLYSYLNGQLFGQPNAGIDMTFSFSELIAHAAKTRSLSAGTIIGSGTVSNLDRSKGSSCIAEIRMLETIANGKPNTPFMHFGDRVRIEMKNALGQSLFGAIDQEVCNTNKE